MSTKDFNSDLSTQILNKEFELENSYSFSTLKELIDLYSIAIEHYALLDDSRYLDFEHRMHTMLSRPEIVRILQSERTPDKSFGQCRPSYSALEKKSNRLIRAHNHLNERSVGNTKRELQIQDLTLQRKLAIRIQSSPQSQETSDLTFEEKIEEIMERSFAEKTERITEIKVKYNALISQTQQQGTLEFGFSEQIKHEMENEIKSITQEIDQKRKIEISMLKQMFNVV